jgi:tRNA(Ile)-lysidine synthase
MLPTPAGLAAEVARLAGPALAPGAPLALAVSGGADSLALLALAADAFGSRAHVLSADHGLRAEAAAECAEVARLSARLGLGHATLRLGLGPGGDVQARARHARYAAMAAWCAGRRISVLLTAHHADDQAETLLMRLARGSGLGGLSGVRPRVELDGLVVLRPLLGARKAELEDIVAARGWVPAADPSNTDPRFDRARARALLARTRWLAAPRLAASAAHLAEAEEALAWAAARAFATRSEARADGSLLLDPEGLPAELRRRLLADGLARFDTRPPGPALARLLARLDAGRPGTLGTVAARPLDGRWLLRPAPPRRSSSAPPAGPA